MYYRGWDECEEGGVLDLAVFDLQPKEDMYRYRGYYMVARRYEFYVQVARTVSHE